MGNKFSFSHLMPGVYAPGDSLLHKTTVRWKIFLGLGLLVLAGFGQWQGIALVFFICLFGLVVAGVGLRAICQRLRTFLWFILFLGVFPVFFTPGTSIEVADGHSLGLTLEGLEAGALFSCRMILMFLVSMIFMHTTKPAELFALQKPGGEGDKGLRAFFREAGTVGLMAFQLLPILFDEVEKRLVKELDEKKISGSLFNKARQVAYLLIPLTVFVFENTEQYSEKLHSQNS
jgi:energy-coupling factor transporter transmembrane protein EcfT